jgi:hypothetical protein
VPGGDDILDLESSFSRVALALFSAGSVAETLQLVVELAEATIDGCEAAGVLVVREGVPVTLAASGPLATRIDGLQVAAGEGPCLDAAAGADAVYAEDLLDDPRWPALGPAAVAAGIRCVLAHRLTGGGPSALNLYARLPSAFGATDRAQGQLFATLAGLAVESAEERAVEEARTANLREALRSRELIGQAQGILMERERIGPEEAFDVLRRASQRMNVKLREVAETLVETGEAPDGTGGGATPPAT